MLNPNTIWDPRKPGEKWRVARWVQHCRDMNKLNFISLEQGGFPSLYVHWLSITEDQKEYLLTLDPDDYVDHFNMFFFTNEADAIMFKLKGT